VRHVKICVKNTELKIRGKFVNKLFLQQADTASIFDENSLDEKSDDPGAWINGLQS
jgi:hypothetical protein